MLHSNLQIMEKKTKNVVENGWWIRTLVSSQIIMFTTIKLPCWAFADNKGTVIQIIKFVRKENNGRKGVHANHQYFLPFHKYFLWESSQWLAKNIVQSTGSIFTNHSQEHSLSFSPKFTKWNVTQLQIGHGLANQKLCYIQMLLNI